MKVLEHIELRSDPQASSYVKNEIVQVRFATENGDVQSREGPNRYAAGDALITGSTGDVWSVTRARFDAKYEPLPPLQQGESGAYRNKPLPVLAKQISEPFGVRRSSGGDLIRGAAGDWLMQYAPGDYGIVENAKFLKVYCPT